MAFARAESISAQNGKETNYERTITAKHKLGTNTSCYGILWQYGQIRPSRHSYEIIKQTKEFIINLPDENLVWATDFCGTKSGKDMDKFQSANLTKEAGKMVAAPSIKECPINLECKLKEIKHLGSHDMFIGEVVCVNAKPEFVENGKVNLAKARILTYLGSEYYVANKKVGDRGICLK